MKNYNFERVYGAEEGEQVEIHRKNHGFHLGMKFFCLILAILFWLVVTNVRLISEHDDGDPSSKPDTESVA